MRQAHPSTPGRTGRSGSRNTGCSSTPLGGEPYWDESACYDFSRYEIDTLERATYALHEMCLDLVQHVIDKRMFGLFLIPPEFEELVVRSWEEDEPSVYGRFDLAFDGVGPPKLLEYNADTPTALVEASVAQWHWLQGHRRARRPVQQHPREADRGVAGRPGPRRRPVHFAAMSGNVEDYITAEYLRDTAIQAGFETAYLDVEEIGWDRARRHVRGPRRLPDPPALQALPVGVAGPRRVRQPRPPARDEVGRAGRGR